MNRQTSLRPASDWGGNIAAYLLMVFVNIMANAVPLGGQTTGAVSAKYPSLFTPAGYTFSIWGLIYLGLAALVIFQALPRQRHNAAIAGIGALFKTSCAANALWIFAWHYDQLALSLLLMACLLLTLVAMYRRLGRADASVPATRRWFVHLPVSLYTGWISVACIANLSAAQTGWGGDYLLTDPVTWALFKLALAGVVTAAVAIRGRDAVFVLVVAWAAAGIAQGQAATPQVAGAASMLALFACMLAAWEMLRRMGGAAR